MQQKLFLTSDVGFLLVTAKGFGHPIHALSGAITGAYPRWEFGGDPESEAPFSFHVVEVFDREKQVIS